MKKTYILLCVLSLGLLVGCAEEQVPAETPPQKIHIDVGTMGYQPQQITLKAGVPAEVTFLRTTQSPCLKEVMIPAFGVEKTPLPLNEPITVSFTPDQTGNFEFICGMDMVEGTILVQP